MNKKVLILGSSGLIGHQVYNYLKDNSDFSLSNISYRRKLNSSTILLDARNEQIFFDHIRRIQPNYILNLPAVIIRQAHERPEGMDEGTLIMSGLNKDRIIESIEVVTNQQREKKIAKIVPDYDVDNVSMKVLRIILSYVDYINRTVWRKEI